MRSSIQRQAGVKHVNAFVFFGKSFFIPARPLTLVFRMEADIFAGPFHHRRSPAGDEGPGGGNVFSLRSQRGQSREDYPLYFRAAQIRFFGRKAPGIRIQFREYSPV